jgi:gluconolactonase
MDKEIVIAGPSQSAESAESPYELLDDRFRACQGEKRFQRLFSEGRWIEGPAYFPAGRYLVWSDVPNNRILRWDELSGRAGIFRQVLLVR